VCPAAVGARVVNFRSRVCGTVAEKSYFLLKLPALRMRSTPTLEFGLSRASVRLARPAKGFMLN